MEIAELGKGLWRWTAPHPDWKPEKGGSGGWEQMVGCVYYEAPDAVVLIDPLAPPEGSPDAERFWAALDRDVARAKLPVSILIANQYHSRSAAQVKARYPGATVHGSKKLPGHVAGLVDRPFQDSEVLPGGVTARGIEGIDEDETAFYLPPHKALVFADALIGIGENSVRLCPKSWAPAGEEGARRYDELFRKSLRKLMNRPIDMLLVSHGPPVVSYGSAALAEALEAEEWGK
jgi:glyoxylase-like metal-dependent hydrolase (beta-lactamase superfamily II)